MENKKIGVLLAGCGVKDGSEIHEATLTLYFLDKHGAEAVCMAPDKDQFDVVNHLTGETLKETRNTLVEAARIARGTISNVAEMKANQLDAIIIPGGFGAAKNLCTFAVEGPHCNVDDGAAALLGEMRRLNKPIGALCIAPSVIARLFGKECSPEITIGFDKGTALALEQMGAVHKECPVDGIIVDLKNKIVTTPCYMLGPGIKEIAAGIEKLVMKILELA
jgi:enhancing lycopene biosynthesis protein 2